MGFDMSKKVELANGYYACAGSYVNGKGETKYALQIGALVSNSVGKRETFDRDNSVFFREEMLMGETGEAIHKFLDDVFTRIKSGTDKDLQQAQNRVTLNEGKVKRQIDNAVADIEDILKYMGNVYSDYDKDTKKTFDSAMKTLREKAPELAEKYEPQDVE